MKHKLKACELYAMDRITGEEFLQQRKLEQNLQAITNVDGTKDISGTVQTVLDKVTEVSQTTQELLDEMGQLLFLPVEEVELEEAKSVCRKIAVPYQTLVALVEELKALAKSKKPRKATLPKRAENS